MKKRTRVLSMLLTLLMVVGILPLSLFAAAGETYVEPLKNALTATTWEEIKATLKENGLDTYRYQDFEGFTGFTDGVYDIPAEHHSGWDKAEPIHDMISAPVTFTKTNFYPFEIKNYKDAFEIREEADGNKALYLGNHASTGTSSDDDNWFDIETADIGAGNDIFVSVDLKMGGAYIAPSNDWESFFCFVTRPKNTSTNAGVKTNVPTVGLHGDGGIFLYDNDKKTDVVGYLSSTEYTRIAVETDLQSNKYYVYINDVLVNPDGCKFISDSNLATIRKIPGNENYTPLSYVPDAVRTYNVSNNKDDAKHKGMYFDNILLAGRLVLTEGNSRNLNIYTMDLSGVTEGATVTAGTIPGTSEAGIYAYINGANTQASKDSVVYFKEADGSMSIKYQNATKTADGGQNYILLNKLAPSATKENIGVNFIISGYFRAGSDKIAGDQLFAPISRVDGRKDIVNLGYDNDRTLKYNSTLISGVKIPTDRFMKVEMHVICNAANGAVRVKVYADDVMVFSASVASSVASNWVGKTVAGVTLAANNPYVVDLHINSKYTNEHIALADDDLHMKDISVQYTDMYNDNSAKFNPFAKKNLSGFVENARITRYFENGEFKTADFSVDGEGYFANDNGSVIGKLSDGVIHSPYAPYTDWAHASTGVTYLTDYNKGADGSVINVGGSMGIDRTAEVITNMYTPAGNAVLYNSYGTSNSYFDYAMNSNKNNENVVLEFDIKGGTHYNSSSQIDLVTLLTSKDPYGNTSSGNANRGDTKAIWIKDGWFILPGGLKVQKLSDTEFTRVSVAIKTPDAVTNRVPKSVGNPEYSSATESVVTNISYEEYELLAEKPVAQDKTPNYTGNKNAYASVVSENTPENGKRTVVTTITTTKTGTYTEKTVVDDGTQWVVTELVGNVTAVDTYEETSVFDINGTYAVYLNGVKVYEDTVYRESDPQENLCASNVYGLRLLSCSRLDSVYVKDYYLYKGFEKPQQFIDSETKLLTDDQSAEPAKAVDIKCGFVNEDGITRYYNELGLPIIGESFTANNGIEYTANENGKLICDGTNHIGENDNGTCPGCGEKLDGVTMLYGNSLVLGSDVKLMYYISIDDSVAGESIECAIDRNYDYVPDELTSVKISSLETINIEGANYYKVPVTLSGKDICANVMIRLAKDSGETGTVYMYSVLEYAEDVSRMPVDAVYTNELRALIDALLIYGNNANAVLAEDLETLPIGIETLFDNVTDIQDNENIFADAYGVVKLVKFTLELKSNIKLKVYFSFDADSSDYPLEEFVITVGGSAATPVAVPELGENIYCLETTVVAADLDEVITFSLINEEEYGMSLSFSALQYAKVMNANANSTDAEKNLMKAIKIYSDAANAYADVDADNRPM